MDIIGSSIVAGAMGLIVTAAVELAKKYKIPAEYSLLGFAVLAGVLYGFFEFALPMEMRTKAVEFGLAAIGASSLIYNLLLKKFARKK